MKYFLIVQSGVKDGNPRMHGPFNSIKQVKQFVELEYEQGLDYIFTILAQEGTGFAQICQAVISDLSLPWVNT